MAGTLNPELYNELKKIARQHLQRSSRTAVINTTMVVHEAWEKLQNTPEWKDQTHFKATASTAMRQVLIDYARSRLAQKRGGDAAPITLKTDITEPQAMAAEHFVLLSQLSSYLEEKSPHLLRVFDLKFFGGMTFEEIAAVTNKSERTLRRDWAKIKGYAGLILA